VYSTHKHKHNDDDDAYFFHNVSVLCSGSPTANIYDLSHSNVKKNFEENVLHNASSNWSENLPKYKTERWKNLPLAEKKVCVVLSLFEPHGCICL
jgi:hypothetical protein